MIFISLTNKLELNGLKSNLSHIEDNPSAGYVVTGKINYFDRDISFLIVMSSQEGLRYLLFLKVYLYIKESMVLIFYKKMVYLDADDTLII